MYFIGEEELNALENLFNRKKLFRYTPKGSGECELFEREFANYLNVNHSLILTSGTNALICALKACDISAGDEVIIPTYTFVATATSVVNVGATPILANIDQSLSLSLESIREKITPRTKAIIAVHMDGVNCNMPEIVSLAREKGIFVIEDCAQAMGGSFKDKKLGTWGDVGCFSFNEDKILSCGEGGACVTNDEILYEKLLNCHDTSALFNPTYQEKFKNIVPKIGMSMRVSEISGAIMRVQLKRLDYILKSLRQRKDIFSKHLLHLKNGTHILAHDPLGDCATTILIAFKNPSEMLKIGKTLNRESIENIPISMRPAHAFWKWSELIGLSKNQHIFYLESIDLINRTLKIKVDLSLSLKETEALAQKIVETIG